MANQTWTVAMIVTSSRQKIHLSLVSQSIDPTDAPENLSHASIIQRCHPCHGPSRRSSPPVPVPILKQRRSTPPLYPAFLRSQTLSFLPTLRVLTFLERHSGWIPRNAVGSTSRNAANAAGSPTYPRPRNCTITSQSWTTSALTLNKLDTRSSIS